MRHIISILLQNEAGALSRVAGLFSSRGYNIEGLNVAPTDDAMVSRLTLVTSGSDAVIDQISSQLGKVVDVVNVVDMTSDDHIERELALFKLRLPRGTRDQFEAMVRDFDGRILDDHEGHFTVELTGGAEKIDRFLSGVRDVANVLAVVRSGVMAVARGNPVLTPT